METFNEELWLYQCSMTAEQTVTKVTSVGGFECLNATRKNWNFVNDQLKKIALSNVHWPKWPITFNIM